jgi:hypothetical protein
VSRTDTERLDWIKANFGIALLDDDNGQAIDAAMDEHPDDEPANDLRNAPGADHFGLHGEEEP